MGPTLEQFLQKLNHPKKWPFLLVNQNNLNIFLLLPSPKHPTGTFRLSSRDFGSPFPKFIATEGSSMLCPSVDSFRLSQEESPATSSPGTNLLSSTSFLHLKVEPTQGRVFSLTLSSRPRDYGLLHPPWVSLILIHCHFSSEY